MPSQVRGLTDQLHPLVSRTTIAWGEQGLMLRVCRMGSKFLIPHFMTGGTGLKQSCLEAKQKHLTAQSPLGLTYSNITPMAVSDCFKDLERT